MRRMLFMGMASAAVLLMCSSPTYADGSGGSSSDPSPSDLVLEELPDGFEGYILTDSGDIDPQIAEVYGNVGGYFRSWTDPVKDGTVYILLMIANTSDQRESFAELYAMFELAVQMNDGTVVPTSEEAAEAMRGIGYLEMFEIPGIPARVFNREGIETHAWILDGDYLVFIVVNPLDPEGAEAIARAQYDVLHGSSNGSDQDSISPVVDESIPSVEVQETSDGEDGGFPTRVLLYVTSGLLVVWLGTVMVLVARRRVAP